jgi:hypothetical protein
VDVGCKLKKGIRFFDGVGRGSRDRTYAEPGVGWFGSSVGLS